MSAGSRAARMVLVGATGRMGERILRLLPQCPQLELTGAVAEPGSFRPGGEVGAGARARGVALSGELAPLLDGTDVVVDFSSPAAVPGTLNACVQAGVALMLGTTGWPATLHAAIDAAAQRIAVLVAANTSLGVSVLLQLIAQAARSLPDSFDVQILEAHHRDKRDAPSGTALALQARLSAAQGGARRAAIASLRGGDVVGEHEVLFLGPGEQLRLRHVATDRDVFARGALAAATWLVAQPPGRYAMTDVF